MKSFVVFSLFLFVTSSLYSTNYPSLKVDLIQDSLSKNANAVVRYDISEVTIFSEEKMEIYKSIAITVFNDKAESLLDFNQAYSENSTELHDIELVYLNANGDEILKPKRKHLSDLNAYDNMSIASSQKFKYYDFIPTSYPVTIVYSLKIESTNTCFIPQWSPVWATSVALEKSTYKIDNQTQIPLHSRSNNFSKFDVRSESENFYAVKNIRPLRSEKYMPNFRNIIPFLEFSLQDFNYEGVKGSADNWVSYGQWMFDSFLKERASVDEEKLKNDIIKNVTDTSNKKEIAKAVYKYVQDNTRYISIQLNEGGFKPMSPAKVDEYKYGDCKGLSFYTIALLDLFDIDANYVVVYAGSSNKQSLNNDFFNHQQANHAILNIPFADEIVWLDATSNVSPFNFLGSFTDDRVVLSVNANKAELISTPDYGSDFNHDIVLSELEIDSDGNISGNYSRDFIGLEYAALKYKSKKDQKEFNKSYSENEFEDFQNPTTTEISFDFDEEKIIGRESMKFSSKSYGEKLGDYLAIPIKFVEFEVPVLKKTKHRKYNVVFLRSQKQESFVTFKLPPDSNFKVDDNTINYKSEFGSYNCEYTVVDNTLEIKRSFEIFKGNYSNNRYQDLRSFFNKIRKHEKSSINLNNKT